jgi:hypothetical protein
MNGSKASLETRGASVGLSAVQILQLIEQYGVPAAEAIIQALASGGTGALRANDASSPVIWAKSAIVTLLKQYHDQILATMNEAEGQALDLLIAALSK